MSAPPSIWSPSRRGISAVAPLQAIQKVLAIGVIPGKALTREHIAALTPRNGYLESDPVQDVLKAVVFERRGMQSGACGRGFVHGFGITSGAMASTMAHDAHNLLVLGANDADMALAAETLDSSLRAVCAWCGTERCGGTFPCPWPV